jgi:PTH1 family peptidyl-tRNA hydrolase
VVGLGNPGEDLAGTRHNIGAEAVTLLAGRHGGRLKSGKERALSCEIRMGPGRALVALAVPTTYMNLSGESVRLLVRRHGVTDFGRLLVVHAELDLPTAKVRLKLGGGTGGHNGLKSLQSHLHTLDFVRLRIGIGRPPGQQDPADYVLKRPGKVERTELEIAAQVAADAVEVVVADGVERAMNSVNAG